MNNNFRRRRFRNVSRNPKSTLEPQIELFHERSTMDYIIHELCHAVECWINDAVMFALSKPSKLIKILRILLTRFYNIVQ